MKPTIALALTLAMLTASPRGRAERTAGFAYDCTTVPTIKTASSTSHPVVTAAPTVFDSEHRAQRWTRQLLRMKPHTLGLADRIVAQNRVLALGFAHRIDPLAATRAISHLALSSEVLQLLGSQPETALEHILGPRVHWSERKVDQCGKGPLVHEYAAGGVLAFRPLRSRHTRALVSQLIAIDTTGAPHVTPLVQAVELRLGLQDDAPVCIVKRDAGHQLAPRALDKLRRTMFVRPRSDGRIGCDVCHTSSKSFGAVDLARAPGDQLAKERWLHVQALAAKTLRRLRARLVH